VRHGADELPRRVARQLRVGVEGDDVPHAGQDAVCADDQRERIRRAAAQQAFRSASLPRLRS
jgi:hypothetical protein